MLKLHMQIWKSLFHINFTKIFLIYVIKNIKNSVKSKIPNNYPGKIEKGKNPVKL